MIGQRVEFPIERGVYEEGVVEEYCEDSGLITVVDDENVRWKGYEYQVVLMQKNQINQ